jgi:hypothetical protein
VGPTNFSTLGVNKQKYDGTEQASAALAITATNWPSPPVMSVGTNRFSITYTSNNFPGITFSVPADMNSISVSNWAAQFNLYSTAASTFVVGVASGTPVLITNPQSLGGSFQLSFTSQASFTHVVQYRTNLTAGNDWQTYSNVVGDGTLKTILVPSSVFSPANQGYIRIATQ